MTVFELDAKINLDTNGYEKDLDGARSKFSSFADGLKGAASAVGDVLAGIGAAAAAGIGAAGTALTALTKQSLDAVGSYEQLVGGIETLFGAGGKSLESYAKSVGKTTEAAEEEYNKLLEAQNKVMENANNAYMTAGLSANQYMEQTIQFSASLIQGLEGDTNKAADVANTAITDMADNVNKMGTTMEAVQNAYRGLARQNFTMLDNLSIGYQGTADEMARLINDSGVMGDTFEATAKNVKEISFDKYIEAIHKIQVEMGISGMTAEEAAKAVADGVMTEEEAFEKLGTTAKEASGTITGSAAAAKAAWQNFLTGTGTAEQFTNVLKTSVGNIKKNLKEIIPRLTEGLTELVDLVAPEIPPIIEEFLPVIISGSSSLLTGLAERLPDLISAILPSLANGVVDVSVALVGVLPKLITSLKDSIPIVVQTIMEKKDDLLKAGKDIIKALMPENFDKLPEITSSAVGFITAFTAKLTDPKNLTTINDKAFEIIGKLIEGLTSPKTLEQLFDPETGVFKIIDNLGHGLVDFADHLLDSVGELLDNFVEFLSYPENVDKINQGGLDIVTHLGKAITSNQSQLSLGHFLVSFCKFIGSSIAAGGGGENAIDWEVDVGMEIARKILKGIMEGNIFTKVINMFNPLANVPLGNYDESQMEDYLEANTSLQIDEWLAEREKALREEANAYRGDTNNVSTVDRSGEEYSTYQKELASSNVPDFVKEQMRKHAKGFYASKPAVMSADIVGEDGDEVLLPLEKNTEWMDKFAAKLDRLLMSDDLTATYQTINNDNATTSIVNNSYESPMLGRITQIIDSFGEKVKSDGDYASFRTNLDAEKPDWIMNEPEMPDFTAIEKLTDRLDSIGGNITITGDIIIQAPSSDAEDIADSFIAAIDEKLRNRQMAQDRSTGGTGWK